MRLLASNIISLLNCSFQGVTRCRYLVVVRKLPCLQTVSEGVLSPLGLMKTSRTFIANPQCSCAGTHLILLVVRTPPSKHCPSCTVAQPGPPFIQVRDFNGCQQALLLPTHQCVGFLVPLLSGNPACTLNHVSYNLSIYSKRTHLNSLPPQTLNPLS